MQQSHLAVNGNATPEKKEIQKETFCPVIRDVISFAFIFFAYIKAVSYSCNFLCFLSF